MRKLTESSPSLQRRRRTNIRAQVVVSFEEAAQGAKRTIRVAQGVPAPKNVDIEIPAGVLCLSHISFVMHGVHHSRRLWLPHQLVMRLRRACGILADTGPCAEQCRFTCLQQLLA